MSAARTLYKRFRSGLRDKREAEYAAIEKFLGGKSAVLDIGCGTGTFLARDPKNRTGIDINPENVDYCTNNGLNATVGSALDIPAPDSSWDIVLSSHVFQVFSPDQAATAVREMARVVKPGGLLIISTLNFYRWFYEHPENVRAYLPATFRRYAGVQYRESSPMWPGMPKLEQEGIWYRHTPLFHFPPTGRGKGRLASLFENLNTLQYGMRITNPFRYDAYIITLRCDK